MNWVTSITTAISYLHKDLFLHLLQKAENINAKTTDGMTVLHAMLRYNFTSICPIDSILSAGADPTIANKDGLTPIQVIIALGMDQEFDSLLAYKADIMSNFVVDTPLHTAVLHNRLKIIVRITEHSSGRKLINEPGERRRSPLALAALKANKAAAMLLLQAGARQDVIDVDQRTPLHIAALGKTPGHLAVISLLLPAPKAVNKVDRDGNTPFNVFMITQAGLRTLNLELYRCFLAAGTNLTISNNKGQSPVLLSLSLFEFAIFTNLLPLLLEYGADISAQDTQQQLAARYSNRAHQRDLEIALQKHISRPHTCPRPAWLKKRFQKSVQVSSRSLPSE